MSECRSCGSTKTDAFLCAGCTKQLADAFTELPGLVEEIATSATRQARVYRSTRRAPQPEQDWRGSEYALIRTAMPTDMDAADLLHRVGNTLTTWARHLAEARGIVVPAPRTERHVLEDVHVTVVRNRWRILREPRIVREPRSRAHSELARWMLTHRDAIRHDEAAAEIHAEITTLRDDILATIDRSPSPFYAGPCHASVTEVRSIERAGTVYVQTLDTKCERDLYAWPGADSVKCDGYRSREAGDEGCGTEHGFADREDWLIDSIEDALIPLDVLHAVTKGKRPMISLTWPPHATVRSWRFRGRLVEKGLDRAGRELFRGGDVLDLVRDWNEREQVATPRRDKART